MGYDIFPSYENVTNWFITEKLNKLMFLEQDYRVYFEFREKEARDFIDEKLKEQLRNKFIGRIDYKRVMDAINPDGSREEDIPVVIINDYKSFFDNLSRLFSIYVDEYFKRTTYKKFLKAEKEYFLEDIWVRATPEDFQNPEEFLRRQIEMEENSIFDEYLEEQKIGPLDFLDNNILCAKNGYTGIHDEMGKEMQFTIYDKVFYDMDLPRKPCVTLPLVRYGIYEKNGKLVCRIGSIQNKELMKEPVVSEEALSKKFERVKYKANEGTTKEEQEQVETKKLLSLALFINMLHDKNITEIEVPSFYVLDYNYHIKFGNLLDNDLKTLWTMYDIRKYNYEYRQQKEYAERVIGKEDLISKIKSEKFLSTVMRILKHYPNGEITSYPDDSDSMLHLSIPVIKNEEEINGTIFRKLYSIQKNSTNQKKK